MRVLNGFLRLSKTIPAIDVALTEISIPTTYEDAANQPIAIEVISGDILIASGEDAATNGNAASAGDYREFNAGSVQTFNDIRIVQGTAAAVVQIWVYEGV